MNQNNNLEIIDGTEYCIISPPLKLNGYQFNNFVNPIPIQGLLSQYLELEYQEINGYKCKPYYLNLPYGHWKFAFRKGDNYYYQKN